MERGYSRLAPHAVLIAAISLVTGTVLRFSSSEHERLQCATNPLDSTDDDDVSLLQLQRAKEHLPLPGVASASLTSVPPASQASAMLGSVVHFYRSSEEAAKGALLSTGVFQRLFPRVALLQQKEAGASSASGRRQTGKADAVSLQPGASPQEWDALIFLLGALGIVVCMIGCTFSMQRPGETHLNSSRASADDHLVAQQRTGPDIHLVSRQRLQWPVRPNSRLIPSGTVSHGLSGNFGSAPVPSGVAGSALRPAALPPKTLPPSSNVLPASNAALETRYCIPADELEELSGYLSAGWFNVLGLGGEPIFHVEATGSAVELTKVYSPGHSEMIAYIRPPPASPRVPGFSHGAPQAAMAPQLLEVCLPGEKLHGTIESWGNGTYSVVQDGRRTFSIGGDGGAQTLSVVSVLTGNAAAKIERRGVTFEGTECVELVIYPGSSSSRVFILACVLGIIILRSWPSQPADALDNGEHYPHLINVAGVSAATLQNASARSLGQGHMPGARVSIPSREGYPGNLT